MLCKEILGNIKQMDESNYDIEYIDIEWFDAFTKIHRKVLKDGTEVGIQLDNDVLKHGLTQGDIIYKDDHKIIAVNIPPCKVTIVTVASDHPHMVAKVCYEIGNRHAVLFQGANDRTFITPYDEPIHLMLEGLHGVSVESNVQKLDFTKAISSSINKHTH